MTGMAGDRAVGYQVAGNVPPLSGGNHVIPAQWDDMRVPLTSKNIGGVNAPDFVKFADDGSGSTGVFAMHFDKNAEEELFFSREVPHDYKLGTDLFPHVHWAPKVNGASDKVVNWGLEYHISIEGQAFGNTTIISGNATRLAGNPLLASVEYITSLGQIDGSGITDLAAVMNGRIFRDATGALGTDNYDNDAVGFLIDFHYQIDSAGSVSVFSKL